MADVKVEQLSIPSLILGEGPHWIQKDQALVFVDYFQKSLVRYFAQTGRHQFLVIDDGGSTKKVSMVIPVEGEPDLFVIGLGNSLAVVRWPVGEDDHLTVKPIILQTVTEDRFNDAKCDPKGRLWTGTLGYISDDGEVKELNRGAIYKYDQELELSQWETGINLSNGFAFSLDQKTCYYIDSTSAKVDAFDYDHEDGKISNRRTVFDLKTASLNDQIPDGMTIDTDGNLWVACFGGGQVICVDPKANNKVIRQVPIPSKLVTSICWGGPNYDILYVTSAKTKLSPEEIAANPQAGGTFAVKNIGAKGLPPVNFKPNLEKLRAKMADK